MMNWYKRIISQKYHYLTLLALVLFGTGIRLWGLGNEGLRLDETQSIWQASHTIEYIKFYMAKNVHLPLHNTLLHYWITHFGSGETAVRMLALIPGVLTIPGMYLLTKEILGKHQALIATALAAISPFWIWYSREIRMYTLVAFVTTMSYYFFVKVLKTYKTRYFLGYILFNTIGIYTHYYFGLVLLVQAVFFVSTWKIKFRKNENKWYTFAGLGMSALALLVAFLPWINMLTSVINAGSYAPALSKPTSFNIFLSLFEFTFGYQPEHFTSFIIGLWPMAILMGFVFLTKRQDPFTSYIYLAILGTFLPIILVFAISVTYRPVYLTRYLMPTTPLYIILIAWYLYEIRGKARYIIGGFLFLVMAFSLYNQSTSFNNPAREDYKGAVTYINKEANARDLVILSPPYNIFPAQYYYEGTAKVVTVPYWDKRKGGIPQPTYERVQEDTELLRKGHRRMFLLISEDLEGAEVVRSYFDSSYTKLDKVQFSKNLWVHVYQAEYL